MSLVATLLFSKPIAPPPNIGFVNQILDDGERKFTSRPESKQSAIQKARLAPTAAASRKRVFDSICSGKSSSAEIAGDVGMTMKSIRRIANGLADDGRVVRKEGFHGRFFYYQARTGEGK